MPRRPIRRDSSAVAAARAKLRQGTLAASALQPANTGFLNRVAGNLRHPISSGLAGTPGKIAMGLAGVGTAALGGAGVLSLLGVGGSAAVGAGAGGLALAKSRGRVPGLYSILQTARGVVGHVLGDGTVVPARRRRSRGISPVELRGFRKVAMLLKKYAGTVRRMKVSHHR